jgi:hypothetical protein
LGAWVEDQTDQIAWIIPSTPDILRMVLNCPAKEFTMQSSKFAEERIAYAFSGLTTPSNSRFKSTIRLMSSAIYLMYASQVQTNDLGINLF